MDSLVLKKSADYVDNLLTLAEGIMRDIFHKAGRYAQKTGEVTASIAILSTAAILLLSPFWAPFLDPAFRAKAMNGAAMMMGAETTQNALLHEASAEAKARQNNAEFSLVMMRDRDGLEVMRVSSQLRR